MKKLLFFFFLISVVLIPALLYTQTMSDYCSVPPYITRTVPPNVVIILDNSKAMLNPAYTGEYEPSRHSDYTGYFKTDKKYCTSGSNFYEAETCTDSDRGPYPGSLLNWAAMSRYDIMMHILIGGKGTPTPSARDRLIGEHGDWPTRTTAAYPDCVFAMTDQGGLNITSLGSCSLPLITEPRGVPIIVSVSDAIPNVAPRGIIQNFVDRYPLDGVRDAGAPRIGIMRYQASRNDVLMDYCPDDTRSLAVFMNIVASEQARPDRQHPGAPLGLAVTRAIQFFKNSCGTSCASCNDPVDAIPCRKNHVLVISSGEASDIPSLYSADSVNEQIRQAHANDIRTDRNGIQTVNFSTVHSFGLENGKDLLRGFSKFGGFVDANANQEPDMKSEWDKNGDAVPDTHFEGAHSGKLQAGLENAFRDILAKAGSGTAVSVLTSSSKNAGSAAHAYFQPVRTVTDQREVRWTGYLQNVWKDQDDNLREDTVNDCRLLLSEDKIMKLAYNPLTGETEAALFPGIPRGESSSAPSCANPQIKSFSDISTIWDAGKKLAKKNPSERTLFTSGKVIRGGVITIFGEIPYPEFKTTMHSTLKKALNPDAVYDAESIVRYIRGECLETGVTGDGSCGNTRNPLFRDRRLETENGLRVWKLGDIMSSTPKVFGGTPLNTYHAQYADRTYYDYISDDRYKAKSSTVFAGANDGMLHAFRAGYLKDTGLTGDYKAFFKNSPASGDNEHESLGEELWGYIPYNAFPYLKYLADQDYCHLYYADLSVKLIDASINGSPGSVRNQNSWRTILLGGMRLGGACGTGGLPADPPPGTPSGTGFSSYFAIDVTDPEHPVPLWEFSDSDMGFAASVPAIVRTGGRDRNGNWYAVVGSGPQVLPKPGGDTGRSATGYVYLLNLSTGELAKKISLDHNAIVGDILAVDADNDYEAEKIYFGTTYKNGATWMGKLVSLNVASVLNTGGTAVSWSSADGKILFSGSYPFTAAPDAARDITGNVWVYSGSGKYYSDLDDADRSLQIFFGLKDRGISVAEANLLNTTHIQTTGEVTGTGKICAYNAVSGSFGLEDRVTSIRRTSSVPPVDDEGWKIYLAPGERVISRPLAVGGLVDFLTYRPDDDPCRYGGNSSLYSVEYTTGVAPPGMALLSPEATSGLSGTVTVYNNIPMGAGAPPAGEGIVLSPPKDGAEQLRKKIQTATGVIMEAENQPVFSVVSRIMHWLKK